MATVIDRFATNLASHRRKRGLSLSALARAARISKSNLSDLERGRGNPSLDTLWALSQALNVPLSALFEDRPHKGVHILPLSEAEVIAAEDGCLTQHLLSLHGRGEVELYVVTLAPGARRLSPGHGSGQFEHVVCIDGHADVGTHDLSALLEQGDLITFPADPPHHYAAVDGPARLLVVHDYP